MWPVTPATLKKNNSEVYQSDVHRTSTPPLFPTQRTFQTTQKTSAMVTAVCGRRTCSAFTPLVWEAYGRIGPATRRWLGAALGGPLRAGARATLLRRVSVALWRSHSRAVAIGYSRCLGAAAEDAGEGEGGLLGSSSLGAHIVE